MPNLNVAILGPPEYAKEVGKKSTTSDITFYDAKQGDVTVSMVEPTTYPEKLASLFYSTSLADVAVVVVDEITPAFGECVVMLDCIGIKKGYMILRNYITPEQVAPLIRGTVLEGYAPHGDDSLTLRETLLSDARKMKTEEPGAKGHAGSVPVDHFFDVKGVGTVILGCVAEGALRRHDQIKVLPTDKQAEIRSIQKHDDDFDWAVKGDRVGFALKGVAVDELDRGTVLTSNGKVVMRKNLKGSTELVKYWQKPLTPGMIVHLGHWMQFEPARIDSIEGDDPRNPVLSLSLQKDLVYLPGSKAVVTYLEGGKLRVAATLDLS